MAITVANNYWTSTIHQALFPVLYMQQCLNYKGEMYLEKWNQKFTKNIKKWLSPGHTVMNNLISSFCFFRIFKFFLIALFHEKALLYNEGNIRILKLIIIPKIGIIQNHRRTDFYLISPWYRIQKTQSRQVCNFLHVFWYSQSS